VGFVYRTLGCGLDARDLNRQAYPEDVCVQLSGVCDPYYPMSELVVLGIRSGWGVWICHHERIRHLLREVVSFAGAVGVCEGEVHWGDHDVRFVEGFLREQGVPRCDFPSRGVYDGEQESRGKTGRNDIWDDALSLESSYD